MVEWILCLFLAYSYGSFMEWFAHKHLMHGKCPEFPSIPKDHAAHHKAYYSAFVEADKPDEKNLALCLEHVLIGVVPGLLLSLLISVKLTIILAILGASYFYLFDRLHSAQHLEATWIPGPWKKAMVFHHFLHHQQPHKNFGVVFFLADWIMGTVAKPSYADKRKWVAINSYMKANKSVPFGDRKPGKCFFNLRYMENGYVPPAPTKKADLVGQKIISLVQKLFIGRISIKGLANCPADPSLYVVSHHSWKEVCICRKVFPEIRMIAACSVMRFCGLGYILGPLFGCFGIEKSDDNRAILAPVECLKSGQDVGICPEGWAFMDGELRSFKTGAARMALLAGCPIVPVRILYGNKESKNFLKLWFPLQVLLNALNPLQRKGAKVIIGESFVPDPKLSVRELTKILEEKVAELK